MATLRNSLLCVFLCALCVLVVKTVFFLDQLSGTVTQVAHPLAAAAQELRGAAREQRVYYKATGKALALTTVRLGRLVESTDARLERLTGQAERTLRAADQSMALLTEDSRGLLRTADQEVRTTGEEGRQVLTAAGDTLAASRANLEEMRQIWPPLARTADSAAESARSVETALAPLRRPAGRIKLVLQWLLGMLKINVR